MFLLHFLLLLQNYFCYLEEVKIFSFSELLIRADRDVVENLNSPPLIFWPSRSMEKVNNANKLVTALKSNGQLKTEMTRLTISGRIDHTRPITDIFRPKSKKTTDLELFINFGNFSSVFLNTVNLIQFSTPTSTPYVRHGHFKMFSVSHNIDV